MTRRGRRAVIRRHEDLTTEEEREQLARTVRASTYRATEDDADDALQDAALALWEKERALPKGQLVNYARFAVREHRDRRRGKRPALKIAKTLRQGIATIDPDAFADPRPESAHREALTVRALDGQRLMALVTPEAYPALDALRWTENQREAARRLGQPLATYQRRLDRELRELRDKLKVAQTETMDDTAQDRQIDHDLEKKVA